MAIMGGKTDTGEIQDVAVSRDGAISTRPDGYTWIDEETITVSTLALPLSVSKVSKALVAWIEVQTADIRYWLSGTLPTTTAGHILYNTDMALLENRAEMQGLRMIRDGSSDATVVVSYGR